jgi:hypothetical protein
MTLRLRAAVVLGTLGLLSISGSWAAVAAGSDRGAQQLFREGVEAARQERWIDARVAFEKAYGLSGRPVVLINLAGAQARTGYLVEATRNYRHILEAAPSAETAPFRKAAADILPALEARVPQIRLRASDIGADDLVEIDGQEISPDQRGAALPLDPGAHTLVVTRAGLERARVSFSLAERESHDISLPVALPPPLVTPQPAPSASHPGAELASSEATPAEPPSRGWWRSPRVWIVLATVAVAATVVTILVAERGDQTFSGNVPPGVISVK